MSLFDPCPKPFVFPSKKDLKPVEPGRGQFIDCLRKLQKSGMTDDQIAEHLDVHTATVRTWLGPNPPLRANGMVREIAWIHFKIPVNSWGDAKKTSAALEAHEARMIAQLTKADAAPADTASGSDATGSEGEQGGGEGST